MMHINEIENERQSSKFDYKVEQVRLLTPEGKETRFFGNRRIDTGEVLSTVTDRYEVLQNETLFETAETLFGKKGMSGWKRKTVVTHGGARARAIYDFPNIGAKIDGQDLHFRLKVQNSFDGSLRASFAVGLFRLVCSNGLAVPVNALNITRKHTSILQEDFVDTALDSAINAFHGSLPAFSKMAEMRITQKDGNAILENFVKQKVMADRMAEKIVAVWERPTYEADRSRTLWNLYNATTQHLTHAVEGNSERPRFELAERVNTAVMQRFVKAARADSINSLLVTLN